MASQSKEEIKRTKKHEDADTEPDVSGRVIWLYSSHPILVTQLLYRVLDFGSPKSAKIKQYLNLKLDDFIIPVPAYPASQRTQVIEQLKEVEDATVLCVGLPEDRQNEDIHECYEGTEAAIIHPSEREFYINMMRSSDSMTYKQSEEKLEEWTGFLSSYFDLVHTIHF